MKIKIIVILIVFLISLSFPFFIIKLIKPHSKEIVFLNLCKNEQIKTEKITEGKVLEEVSVSCQKKETTREFILGQLKYEIDEVERKQKIIDWIPSLGAAIKNIVDILRFDLRITNKSTAEYAITEPKKTVPSEAMVNCNFDGQSLLFSPGSGFYPAELLGSTFFDIPVSYEKIGNVLGTCNLIPSPLRGSFLLSPGASVLVNVREAYLLEFFADRRSYLYVTFVVFILLSFCLWLCRKILNGKLMKKLLKKLIPDWLLSIYHWKLALLGTLVYGFPSRKIKVIGVTGTKGKSTVVCLAGQVLRDAGPSTRFARSGQADSSMDSGQVGWISSLTIFDGKNEVMNPFHMTMPGRFFIQKTLAEMVKNGCEYALVEVTSEGIKQSRHRFIKWAGAAFTNLAPEHLEAHGGFENYRAAKMKLFEAASKNPESFGVYNLDDENVKWFQKYSVGKKYGYGALSKEILKDHFATLVMTDIKLSAQGSEFKINNTQFKTNLLGEFNVYNCAAAAAIGEACGVKLEEAAQALEKIKAIPGRLEIINEGQDFSVVVDLAHTPDSYEKVFRLFNQLKPEGARIISIFGSAGGGRDKWKRPELGRIASQYSDQVFICNEDPYDEDPLTIANEIMTGCDKNKTDIILNRRAAIARGLAMAQAGDIVLFLGKGTEQTYVEGSKAIAWDDRVVAREELKKLTRINR